MIRTLSASIFLATLAGVPALAGDFSPDADRILGDPAYLPLRGQIFGQFGYSYNVDSYQFDNDNPGSPVRSYHRQTNDFQPRLSYGITDDISVSANFGWSNERTSQTFTEQQLVFSPAAIGPADNGIVPIPGPGNRPTVRLVPVSVERRSIGASNPNFGATWRVIDQRTAPVNLDLAVSYAPDIFQARGASVYATGTRASGGQRGTVSAAVSRELQLLTVRAYGMFGYDGRQDTGNLGYVTRDGAHPDYAAGVQSQVRLLPFLALNTGASISHAARFDSVNISTFDGTTSENAITLKPSVDLAPYVGLVFPLFGQRAVGEVNYQHDFVGDEKTVSPFNGRYFNQQSNVFTTSIRFVLG